MPNVVVGVLGRSIPEATHRVFDAAGLTVRDGLRVDALDQSVDVVVCPVSEVAGILDNQELLSQGPIVVAGARDQEPITDHGLPTDPAEYFYWDELETTPAVVANRLGRVGRAQHEDTRTQSQLRNAIGLFNDIEAVFSEDTVGTDERLGQLLKLAADRLGYPIAFITRIEDGTQEVVAAVGDHELLQPGMTGDFAEAYCQGTVEQDRPVVLPNVPASDFIEDQAFEEYKLYCYVGATIHVNDEVYGTFCFADIEPREDIVIDVHSAVVQALADRTGLELSQPISQLRTVFNSAPNPIVVYDGDGEILDVNARVSEQLRRSREELLTMQVTDLGVELEDDEWTPPPSDELTIIDGKYTRADGTTYVLEVWIAAVEIANETRYVAIAQNVTDRVEYERHLETQRNSLELLNEVMRHDIRNDLQLIQAYAEELTERVDSEGTDALQVIKDAAAHSIDLTVTGRDLAQVILDAHEEPREVELAPIIEAQCDAIRKAGPDATVTIEGTLPDVTVAGTQMLDTVFRNILKNALQHNDKDKPEITVSTSLTEDTVTIRIADNGPGIPDGQKEEIFGHGEHGLESGGSGIGLYLVKTLVTEYGGALWAEDNDPEGAVFVVELPVV